MKELQDSDMAGLMGVRGKEAAIAAMREWRKRRQGEKGGMQTATAAAGDDYDCDCCYPLQSRTARCCGWK